MTKIKENKNSFFPYFLVFPHEILRNKTTNMTDLIVFGAIYYYENLSKKMCITSNPEIGRIAGISDSTVGRSLRRLEKSGYIKRFFRPGDKGKKRFKIETLIEINVSKSKVGEKIKVKSD